MHEQRVRKRRLQELNLMDNFLFFEMVNHPIYGEPFTQLLLKIILGREVGKLKVIPQKEYYPPDTGMHGARLDVYLDEEELETLFEKEGEPGTIYDLEPDQTGGRKRGMELPRRVRFYHAVIDAHSLKSGESYQRLKNVIVIMIVNYDPFGKNRMVYTVKNQCVEEPDMEYEDGAKTVFLYTRGTEGTPSEQLAELLRYMDGREDAVEYSENIREIDRMVSEIKRESGMTVKYMRMWEERREILMDGIEQGKAEGRTEGKREGIIEGKIKGKVEGKASSILELLAETGPVPENLQKRVMEQTEETVLSKWLKLAAKSSSIEEFCRNIDK